jgi:hypothetical protein
MQRLDFAEKRLHELVSLNDGDLPGADVDSRQQLIQEFFFHLIGAIEFTAQLVNDKLHLVNDPEKVSIGSVSRGLQPGNPLKPKLSALYAYTKGAPLPADPYSDDGYIFRLWNYRHQVAHRGGNAFYFRIGSEPRTSLFLDPRHTDIGPSEKSAQEELYKIFQLVKSGCGEVLGILP